MRLDEMISLLFIIKLSCILFYNIDTYISINILYIYKIK